MDWFPGYPVRITSRQFQDLLLLRKMLASQSFARHTDLAWTTAWTDIRKCQAAVPGGNFLSYLKALSRVILCLVAICTSFMLQIPPIPKSLIPHINIWIQKHMMLWAFPGDVLKLSKLLDLLASNQYLSFLVLQGCKRHAITQDQHSLRHSPSLVIQLTTI